MTESGPRGEPQQLRLPKIYEGIPRPSEIRRKLKPNDIVVLTDLDKLDLFGEKIAEELIMKRKRRLGSERAKEWRVWNYFERAPRLSSQMAPPHFTGSLENPRVVMATPNEKVIAEEKIPVNPQFITSFYALVDINTLNTRVGIAGLECTIYIREDAEKRRLLVYKTTSSIEHHPSPEELALMIIKASKKRFNEALRARLTEAAFNNFH